jgi:phosphoadenosine phosphosulfate reductase
MLRKVEPNQRYLAELDGYVTGLRRTQGVTRSEVRKVEIEEPLGLVKINPLADWSREQVWDYVRDHRVPVNRLHAEGFPSVGCGPCTRAVAEGDDPRSGRWWWENEDTRECGLHVGEEKDGSGI